MTDIDDTNAEYCLESYDFGPDVGELSFQQCSGKYFHQQCLSANSQDMDNTGTRIHQGVHVLIRFLAKRAHILRNQDSWLEIGAGSGMGTLAALTAMCRQNSNRPRVVITDGNEKCLSLIRANYHSLLASLFLMGGEMEVMRLNWGDEDDINCLLAINNHKPFDVIVGSELIYYRVDPNHLVQTVTRLAGPNTIFIHAHILRVAGMGTELVSLLEEKGFDTYEYNVEDIVDYKELANNPSFREVRTLVTVPRNQGNEILETIMGEKLASANGDTAAVDCSRVVRRFVENNDDKDEVNIFSVLMQDNAT